MDGAPRRYAARTGTAWMMSMLCSVAAAAAGLGPSVSIGDLQGTQANYGLISNAAFAPDKYALHALEPFAATLTIPEAQMTTVPATFKSATVLGRDPRLFPAVELAFFTDGNELVPLTQEVILSGSAGRGRSYWDLIVQPGAVWSSPGEDGWSRAGFPFALVNALEGETHNGLATFAYKRNRITQLRVQIVQQTAPFYVVDYFTATAHIPARLAALPRTEVKLARSRFQASQRDRLAIAPFSELAARLAPNRLKDFDDGQSAADIVASALDVDGTLYMGSCDTAEGPLPWCDRTRFGVWSATKALINELTLLHLAQKYGPGVFSERIIDYVPEAAAIPGWKEVRFEDAANMATGVGNGSLARDPNHILEGGLDNYAPWYEARTERQKILAVLAGATAFPWGPGQVARYRDQDMFMLGVAMDRYVKKKSGATAAIWTLLATEVLEPIGILVAPINKTLEEAGKEGQPLMAFGFYPTIGDMVRIARLYQNEGAYKNQQLLYAPRVRAILARTPAPGLPTGQLTRAGAGYYFNAFWKEAYATSAGCTLYYPQMEGWGGTVIALFPGKITGIRIAKIWEDDTSAAAVTLGMAAAADQLHHFSPDESCYKKRDNE